MQPFRIVAVSLICGLAVVPAARAEENILFSRSEPQDIILTRSPALLSASAWLDDEDGVIGPGEERFLCFLVENISSGKAYEVTGWLSGAEKADIEIERCAAAGTMNPGDRRLLLFRVAVPGNTSGVFPLRLALTERYDGCLAAQQVRLSVGDPGGEPTHITTVAPLTVTFPTPERRDSELLVVIIANEDYRLFPLEPTRYAWRDGDLMAGAFRALAGCAPEGMIDIRNATAAEMAALVGSADVPGLLALRIVPGRTRCLIYFTGRCRTDDRTGATLLLPVDVHPEPESIRERGFPLVRLVESAAAAGARSIAVLLDTTLAVPAETLLPGTVSPPEGMGVLTSGSPGEAANRFHEAGHGLFSYVVAANMRDRAAGSLTMGGLYTLAADETSGVPGESSRIHGASPQHPAFAGNPDIILWGDR